MFLRYALLLCALPRYAFLRLAIISGANTPVFNMCFKKISIFLFLHLFIFAPNCAVQLSTNYTCVSTPPLAARDTITIAGRNKRPFKV